MGMPKRVFFFATEEDIVSNLLEMEKTRDVKYVERGNFTSQDFGVYSSVSEIKDLCINKHGWQGDSAYLIVDAKLGYDVRKKVAFDGRMRYLIDQEINPYSTVFCPSGFYDEKQLVHGEVSTIHENEIARDLHKVFCKSLVKGFKKLDGHYVSKGVLDLPEDTRFITISIKSPPGHDFNLKYWLDKSKKSKK